MRFESKNSRIFNYVLVLGLAIIFLAILMIFLGSNAQADIIVDQAGGGDYLTIQEGVDNAIPGENIFVWDGSYNENITIDKSVHLIGNGSATTIIDGFGTMNNIINITAEDVEITGFNITESGIWYGIWANVGGFNINDNTLNTQDYAIYMDIDRLNSGSTTIGDIIVDNNEVIGTHGFYFNIWFEEPLSGSDLIFGNTVITNNTLYNSQTGIEIDRYTVFNMDQGSVTWGDILVKDNFVSSQSNGIFFWGIFWNITDVNIDLGIMDFSGNNITAQSNGIYIDWWDFADGIYGNTIATIQDTYVNNNDLISQSGYGLILQTDIIGNIIYDSTSITTGDFYIYSNNITSESAAPGHAGIHFYMSEIAQEVYNDSSVSFGNIYIDSNNVDSSSRGISFNIVNSFGSEAYDNALVNIGDVSITNNEILSVNEGVYISFDTVGNTMYDQASSIIGNILITRNNITATADGINLYMVSTAYNMYNDSSVDIGNYNIESNIINAGRYGIYFETDVFGSYLYGNAQVTYGDIHIVQNDINSSDHGIYLLRTFCGEVMYGLSSLSFGNIIIDDNDILSGGNGIYLYMNHDGIFIWNDAYMTMGYFTMDSNNITSVLEGIFIYVEDMAKAMYNNTMFSMGDFTINYNNINSTSWIGIHFGLINIGNDMAGNTTVTLGNFLFINNNITAFDDGMLFEVYDIGFNMRDRAVLTMKDFILNDNVLECGPSSDVIDSVVINIGGSMHGDSYISLGSWNIEDNTILSGYYGIHLSSENLGYDMADNSNLMYGDLFIINNVVNVTGNRGIEIDYMKYGMNMAGSSSFTGGNMSIINNIVASRDQSGLLLWYDQIGNNLYNFSYVSTGWIDISYNNFSSINNYGAYLSMYRLGDYIDGNSQVYIGDVMFSNNNVRSDTMDAVHFYQFYQNAYRMYNDSYVQIGNVLVNDNYLNAGGTGDGIELFQWQQNAYELSHNASVDFGNFEFNRNTIEAEANGIYARNTQYWACYLNWNNRVTIGHWQFNDNKINATGETGISINNWYDIGSYMYGTSTLTVGNLEVLRNVINADGGVGIDVSIRDLAYYNYGSSQCYFGDFLFNNNIVNASGDGIYISAIQDSASFMYNNSYAHFGNIEVNNNDIIAGYNPLPAYDGIYFYFYNNGYTMYDNSEAYFGHLHINNNTITCHDDDGILLDVFNELGASMYDNSYFEIGNLEVCGNWIDANDTGINIWELGWLAYTNYHNSTAVFGDFLFDANTIYAGADGIYIYADYWACTMTGTTSATFGDFSVSNNIIESQNQGIYYQYEYAGYDMHDMSRFQMGNLRVLNNSIISGQDPASVDSYGIFYQTQYVGYEMHNQTQAIVGSILFNDNAVTVLFGTSASGIYIGWMSDYGAYMYDMASFTMNGNIEVCRNTINTSDGDDGILCDILNFGSYLYGDNTASFGNILFNDNTIIDAYNTGIYISMATIGYITYGNSSVTIGNIELNNNDDIQIVNGSYYSGIYFYLDDMGSNMFDGSIFNMGHIQMNDNNIYNSYGYGLGIEAYRLGYEMYNSSSAYFGNFEVLRNNITSKDDGIYLSGFQYFAANMYNNASAFFRDFFINNNIINTTSPGSDGIYIEQFRFWGYQMNHQSYAEFGNFECSGNEVDASPLAYGIYIWCGNWANWMYDNATFMMGDWLINNNTVISDYDGIIFYCSNFGSQMYDNSSAYLGMNEIMFNTVNSTDNDGIEAWWWNDFGSGMYDYSYFEVGSCYIMFNNITTTSSLYYGLETGLQSTGYFVRDEAEAYFGDYIISNNVIYSEGGIGIDLWYDSVGYWLDNTNLPECRAIVEVGRVMVIDNIITVPNGKGIYIDGWDVAYSANDYSSVTTGGLYINRNTINSYDHGIDIYMYELGENNGNNAQVWLGSFVIDDNVITATNGNGIYIYSEFFAYSTSDSAFVHMDDIFITNNDIVAGITGIELTCEWWIDLYTSSSARAPGLWVTGNNVSAPVSAFNYTTIRTPTNIDPGTTFSSGNVTISDNIFDGGLFGVRIDWRDMLPSGEGQPDFYFENNSIKNGTANSIGLYMMNIQNSTIESLYLDSYDQGIYVRNTNIWYMFNSTISNTPSYDLNLTLGSFIGAVNTTFDNASVYFEDDICLLNVGWFMNVYVQSQVFLPVPEANLTVKNVDGTDIFNGTTNLNGRVFYLICWEYQENITGIIKNFNDYTADANKAGSFGSAVPNPTMNQTRLIVITLLDFIPPTIFSDNSDTAGTTGDPFYFEINASDNMGIVSVHVNFRYGGVGPYINRTMNGTGPYWFNENMPSDYVGFIEYYFTAVDSGGFWVNTTPTTAPITDNDPPTIITDNSDTFATTGETFNFIVDATDNINMSEVRVVWWFGTGAPTNDTMTGIGPYTSSIPVPSNSLDQLHYYFTMNDTAGNWLVGPQVDINVTDNDPPTFAWVSQPSAGTTGESVLVSLLATDNINITYYKIDIDGVLYDLIKDGDYYNYTINIPSDSVAPITYSIILNDSANNTNIITPPMITVTDNDQPTYSGVSQPISGTTGESVLVSILATDNIGITYYKIDIDGTLYDLIKDGDYYNYTINIPSDSSADISYSLILNDSADNSNIISPPMITVTDNDQPTYSWVSQPFSGTTGESVLVSILASDNIDITYYKIEIDGVLYDLTKDGDYYNYTINIPLDSTASITYRLIINDSANNPNIIPDTVIAVTDNDAPIYNWVSKPTGGVVGSSVLVSLNAYDNIGIINYTIYIDGVPFDMVKDGDYYNYTIDIPPGPPVDITYNVTFRDAEGHIVETGDTVINVITVDIDAPEYSWILHPTTGTTGESVLVSLLATDNVGITYYKIEIDGVLYDLIKNGDYYDYTITFPTDSLASITYNVVFNDSANNPNSIAPTVITVTDNDAPTYNWVLQPSTGIAGELVLISLRALDNIGVTYYKIEIDGTLHDLVQEGDYFNYTINLPPGSSASITYDIIFKDTADNEITTGDTVITVTIPVDIEPPDYDWVSHPDAGTTGDSLLVSLLATDNIGITYYKISVDGILYDLVKDGDYYNYTINIPTDSQASITYFVVFNDSANNPNTAVDTVITVTDNDPGTISNPASDTSGQKGKEFNFQIDASDNIGISEVKVLYWFGDDDSQKNSLTLEESNGTYSGSFTPDESGTMHYYFEVTDDAGNTFESSENTVDIASEPEEEEANILPWIILVIVIVIVLLLFFLTKMRKKEPEELPAEPEEGIEEEEAEVEPEEELGEVAEDLEEEVELEGEPGEELEPEEKLGEEGIEEEEFEVEPEEGLEEDTKFEEIEPEEKFEGKPEEGLEKEE